HGPGGGAAAALSRPGGPGGRLQQGAGRAAGGAPPAAACHDSLAHRLLAGSFALRAPALDRGALADRLSRNAGTSGGSRAYRAGPGCPAARARGQRARADAGGAGAAIASGAAACDLPATATLGEV